MPDIPEFKKFTKEFLKKLKSRSDGFPILDYLCYHQKKSFGDAILEMATFFRIELEYEKDKG